MTELVDSILSLANVNLSEDDIKELEDSGFKVFKTVDGLVYRVNFIDFDRLIVIVSPVTVLGKEKGNEVVFVC